MGNTTGKRQKHGYKTWMRRGKQYYRFLEIFMAVVKHSDGSSDGESFSSPVLNSLITAMGTNGGFLTTCFRGEKSNDYGKRSM